MTYYNHSARAITLEEFRVAHGTDYIERMRPIVGAHLSSLQTYLDNLDCLVGTGLFQAAEIQTPAGLEYTLIIPPAYFFVNSDYMRVVLPQVWHFKYSEERRKYISAVEQQGVGYLIFATIDDEGYYWDTKPGRRGDIWKTLSQLGLKLHIEIPDAAHPWLGIQNMYKMNQKKWEATPRLIWKDGERQVVLLLSYVYASNCRDNICNCEEYGKRAGRTVANLFKTLLSYSGKTKDELTSNVFDIKLNATAIFNNNLKLFPDCFRYAVEYEYEDHYPDTFEWIREHITDAVIDSPLEDLLTFL